MKTLRAFLLVIGIALVSLTLPSCLDDDDSYSLGDPKIRNYHPIHD